MGESRRSLISTDDWVTRENFGQAAGRPRAQGQSRVARRADACAATIRMTASIQIVALQMLDNQDKGYSASRSSAAARSSSSSAKLFSRSAAGSPTRPRARRRACSARSRSAAGVSAQRGDRGGIVRETHGEKLSLRITNLCYWTRRRPATCSANRRPGYSGHGNTQHPPRIIDFIRLAKASIANGLGSTCIPGSRVPLPIATFSV